MLHLKLLLIIERLLGNYALCPVSPWWLTLCPSKWSPLGMGVLLGGLLDESSYHSQSYLLLFTPLPLRSPHLLGFSGVLAQEGIVPHFMGRRGLRPRGNVAGKR
jgi:hypothetical protein